MRARGAFALVLIVGAVTASCGGRDQWIIEASTDAPVPSWGDRVLFELLDESGKLACDDCRREFAVDAKSFPISFGAVPPSAGGARHVRGRFYRSEQAGPDGLPQGSSLIDYLGKLPDITGAGTTRLLLPLTALCFGVPSDFAKRVSCNAGEFGTTAGDLGPEQELGVPPNGQDDFDLAGAHLLPGGIDQFNQPCPSEIDDGMVCAQSVGFLLGDARSVGIDTDFPTQPELPRLPLAAILVDRDEVTVGALRSLVRRGLLDGDVVLQRGDVGVPPSCTFLGANDATNDALPLNCISRDGASEACAAMGKLLIDETHWEMIASNGGAESRFPWGDDTPTCDRGVLSVDDTCKRTGPIAGGSDSDVNAIGIRNLGGNLSEWVSDRFAPYSDSCWGGPFETYGCTPDVPGFSPHRGGSWSRRGTSASSFARFASVDGGPSPDIGFRCYKEGLAN